MIQHARRTCWLCLGAADEFQHFDVMEAFVLTWLWCEIIIFFQNRDREGKCGKKKKFARTLVAHWFSNISRLEGVATLISERSVKSELTCEWFDAQMAS